MVPVPHRFLTTDNNNSTTNSSTSATDGATTNTSTTVHFHTLEKHGQKSSNYSMHSKDTANNATSKKKKKFFSSTRSAIYGTPNTGLLLPSKKNNILYADPQIMSPSHVKTAEDPSLLFRPMVDPNNNGVVSSVHVFGHGDSRNNNNGGGGGGNSVMGAWDHGKEPFVSVTDRIETKDIASMIDIASMYDPKIHLPCKPDFSDPSKNYEASTPLGEELMKYIGVLGSPITLAEYMKRCLRDEKYGYYTNPPKTSHDVDYEDANDDFDTTVEEGRLLGRGHRLIGQAGDFTTAPEISQIFGECVTVWLLTQYEALGKPSRIQLVELGPGRGTLMCDILRSAKNIKGPGEDFIKALGAPPVDEELLPDSSVSWKSRGGKYISGVHFVEVSENLRITQREALQKMQVEQNLAGDSRLSFDFIPWKSKEEQRRDVHDLVTKLRHAKAQGENITVDTVTRLVEEGEQKNDHPPQGYGKVESKTLTSCRIPIHWHDSLDTVPSESDMAQGDGNCGSIPTFIIGQEFFDALPVHVFQKTEAGWREHMVDVAIEEEDENDNSKKIKVQMRDGTYVETYSPLSSAPNPMSTQHDTTTTTTNSIKKKPRFRHVLSPGITPALRSLLHLDADGNPLETKAKEERLQLKHQTIDLIDAPVGTILEVCPEGLSLIQDIALRIEKCRGAAIIVDYGNEGSRDTLRAFQKHQQVDILSRPGAVDITADVDFSALKNAVNVSLRASLLSRQTRSGYDSEKDGAASNLPFAFGPKTQGEFLASMGAVERTLQLIEDDNTTDEQAEELCTALQRLMSREEMGERFKVLAIAHKKDGIFAPPGF